MNGLTSAEDLWFLSRSTGVVALVLLTVVVVLGVAVNRKGRLPGLPRFAVTSLHRAVSLLAVAFLGIHIGTAIADPFVTIGIVAVGRAVPVALPAVLARPGRRVGRPDAGAGDHQPAAGPDRPPHLAGGALAGLRQLAGGDGAQHRVRSGHAARLAGLAHHRLRGRGGGRAGLADRRPASGDARARSGRPGSWRVPGERGPGHRVPAGAGAGQPGARRAAAADPARSGPRPAARRAPGPARPAARAGARRR